MKILTLENEGLDLNTLSDQIEEDIRFSVPITDPITVTLYDLIFFPAWF